MSIRDPAFSVAPSGNKPFPKVLAVSHTYLPKSLMPSLTAPLILGPIFARAAAIIGPIIGREANPLSIPLSGPNRESNKLPPAFLTV